ncbi:MAG: DUF6249 domain-containing protein, partial [Gammaproteobacteria bacterium]|nr:DUF6249 domain-containing protein [Gammaproteobacteria bacterium]
MDGLGAGLAALAFWGFLAAVVVGGIWYGLRERQAQFDTVARMIESGQKIDEALVDRVLGSDKQFDRNLKVGGLIALFAAPGVAILGWFISKIAEEALFPLLGVSALAIFVGAGLLVASK